MKYKIGDIVEFNGVKGKIEDASVNTKIGFSEENNREPVYTIVFRGVPESKIYNKDGNSINNIEESPQKKRKSTTRKSKLHSISDKSSDK